MSSLLMADAPRWAARRECGFTVGLRLVRRMLTAGCTARPVGVHGYGRESLIGGMKDDLVIVLDLKGSAGYIYILLSSHFAKTLSSHLRSITDSSYGR